QVAKTRVGFIGRPESGVLPHRAGPGAVHVGSWTAREGRLSRQAEVGQGIEAHHLEVVGAVKVRRIVAAGVKTGFWPRRLALTLRRAAPAFAGLAVRRRSSSAVAHAEPRAALLASATIRESAVLAWRA